MVEMTVDSVRVSVMNYQRVVILKEKDADRYLPIWIGAPEADAIVVQLQETPVARPLTHDLMNSMIAALGANVESVVVNDLNNDTFYARVLLKVEDKNVEAPVAAKEDREIDRNQEHGKAQTQAPSSTYATEPQRNACHERS